MSTTRRPDATLAEIWARQLKFNERFFRGRREDLRKLSPADRVRWTKEFVLHVEGELHELLGETSWRMHRAPDDDVVRSNVLEEWVDCLKFLCGLAQVWGFSAEEVAEEFHRKSDVVEYRYKMERTLADLDADARIVAVDIDGVLNDYPADFLRWVNGPDRVEFETYDELRERLTVRDRMKLKDDYRQSGAKRHQVPRDGAKELLDGLHAEGFTVVLLSKRPYWRFARIYADTLEWLKANGLRADAVLFHPEKHRKILESFPNLEVMIEDDPAVASEVRSAGYRVVMVRSSVNAGVVDDGDVVAGPKEALARVLSKEER